MEGEQHISHGTIEADYLIGIIRQEHRSPLRIAEELRSGQMLACKRFLLGLPWLFPGRHKEPGKHADVDLAASANRLPCDPSQEGERSVGSDWFEVGKAS